MLRLSRYFSTGLPPGAGESKERCCCSWWLYFLAGVVALVPVYYYIFKGCWYYHLICAESTIQEKWLQDVLVFSTHGMHDFPSSTNQPTHGFMFHVTFLVGGVGPCWCNTVVEVGLINWWWFNWRWMKQEIWNPSPGAVGWERSQQFEGQGIFCSESCVSLSMFDGLCVNVCLWSGSQFRTLISKHKRFWGI